MRVRDIVIGETYNGLKVVKDLGTINSLHRYLCICPDCGKEFSVAVSYIGKTSRCKSCSLHSRLIDLTGRRFGRLVVLEYVGRIKKHSNWLCRCDCGKEKTVPYQKLIIGETSSCGCLEAETRRKNVAKRHARVRLSVSKEFSDKVGELRKHPLYHTWKGLFYRCYNPHNHAYKDYGGRGIKVCDRWKPQNMGFENFVNDMGERPSKKHSIDRIDNDGDYCPENCRWATRVEQANNTRTNAYYVFNGRKQSLKLWCDELGCNYSTVLGRRQKGITTFHELFYGIKE